MLSGAARRVGNLFRAQDFAWLLFVGALLWGLPETNYNATILIIIIGVFQVTEPRLKLFASVRGQFFSVAIKLILSYLLVGYTHTFDSPLWSIFLVPLVSAATFFGFASVVIVTLIASVSYFSFVLLVPNTYVLPPDLYSVLSLRVSFFAIIAFVVFEQARAKRLETERTKEANKNLQQAQVSLRRSERLAALGQLTAGLAHELRNPLGIIKASAEMLNQEMLNQKPQVMKEMAGYIESEVDRMNGLITSFLNFARPLEIHPVMADLGEVVTELIRRHAAAAELKGVSVVETIAPEARKFVFDPATLAIALSNLVQNAVQASAGGTTVRVKAVRAGDEVELSVEDQGEGISPQNLENIFNPFFTTKSEGVGLGLAIVSKIVDEHHGKIGAVSAPGEGTTFRMVLPAGIGVGS
jgi:signal transduction histidine kinase